MSQYCQRGARIAGYLTAFLLLLSPAAGWAQTGVPMPVPIFQGLDASGNACASCKLYAFVTGTSTPLDTYQEAALTTPHANPVVLNSAGRATIYLIPGRTYRFRLDTAADVTVWGPIDGVASLNAISIDRLSLATQAETITAGVISVGGSQITVDTEAAAATDDLDTINLDSGSGLGTGSILVIRPANVSRVVRVTSSGNVRLAAGNYRLNTSASTLTLLYDGSNWRELARSGGGATVVTTTATGTQNDFDPGAIGHETVVRANNASALTITGFTPCTDGQRITVYAVNGLVSFAHANTGSTVGQRLQNIATSASTSISTGGFATYVCDATAATNVWRLTAHDQGAWITPTFAAGNFTAATGNWTVDASPDYVTYAYRLSGRTLSVQFSIGATDVSATPAHLLMAVPGGFTLTKEGGVGIMVGNATTTLSAGMADWLAGGTTFRFFISPNSTTWSTTASDNTYVRGSMTVEVN